MKTRRTLLAALSCLLVTHGPLVGAQEIENQRTRGQAVYLDACAACHAPDGSGMPRDRVGFDTPLPDFTDCAFASPETSADWVAVAHHGGSARAFSRRMPAFGEALSGADIELAVAHVRGFCADRAWPRGELNLPRPLVTEKAFPENEAVLDVAVQRGGGGGVTQRFVYERRIGPRTQYEVVVPFDVRHSDRGWQRGLGDVALAVKSAVFHDNEAGKILTIGSELTLPTGKETEGLGSGVTSVEPFVAVGLILPHESFVHIQSGVEGPVRGGRFEAFWRAATGITLLQGTYGRSWTPMIELLGARELERGQAVLWDIVPQIQISLSRRQHILVNAGIRLPVNRRDGRSSEFLSYLLWDWFDGRLFDGWR